MGGAPLDLTTVHIWWLLEAGGVGVMSVGLKGLKMTIMTATLSKFYYCRDLNRIYIFLSDHHHPTPAPTIRKGL